MDKYAGMRRVTSVVRKSDEIVQKSDEKAKGRSEKGSYLRIFLWQTLCCALLCGGFFAAKFWGGSAGVAAASAVKEAVAFDAVSFVSEVILPSDEQVEDAER